MNDIGTAPLQVVGYEGIFGCLAMFCVLLPIVQHTPGQDGSGLHEDSWETWHVGSRTPPFLLLLPATFAICTCHSADSNKLGKPMMECTWGAWCFNKHQAPHLITHRWVYVTWTSCVAAHPDLTVLYVSCSSSPTPPPYMVPTLVLSLLCYNIAGMFVTDEIGAVARTVLETMRTLFVWIVDLVLWYTPLGLGRLGEKWDNYSYLQLVG